MEFEKVVSSRRSIRRYKTDAISEEKLRKLRGAFRAAPTGTNAQPFKLIFVTDAALRRELVEKGCHQPGFADAPLIAVPVCEKDNAFDTAIALDHLILAAADEGLGTCWVGWIEREAIKKLLRIPAELYVPVIVPVGYADEQPEARARKPESELFLQNTYR